MPPDVLRRDGCPKRMVYGPCGGVRAGGRCEVDDRECPFVVDPAPPWPKSATVSSSVPDGHRGEAPFVLCDFRPDDPSPGAVRALAHHYAGWAGTVLLGEHHEKIDLPNVLVAQMLQDEGVSTWVTVTCRDRNSVALEADLAALAAVGVAGVHCVTGDARAPHVRPDSTPVFDLDSLRLARLARAFGLTVSVAESPDAEPRDRRAFRAAEKFRAGASWCIVNAGVAPATLASFITDARAQGARLRFGVSIPVFTDEEGARRLQRLPGVELDPAAVAAVLDSGDPVQAGIDNAIRSARAALALDGVDSVNLSGPASTTGPAERAAVVHAVVEGIR